MFRKMNCAGCGSSAIQQIIFAPVAFTEPDPFDGSEHRECRPDGWGSAPCISPSLRKMHSIGSKRECKFVE